MDLGKILTIVGGVVIAGALVIFCFMYFNSQKETGAQVMKKTSDLTEQLMNSEWTTYANKNVTGAEVLSIISHFENGDTYVSVDNGKGEIFYVYSDASLSNKRTADEERDLIKAANKRGDAAYINGSSQFFGTLDIDPDTEAILGIKFEKVN